MRLKVWKFHQVFKEFTNKLVVEALAQYKQDDMVSEKELFSVVTTFLANRFQHILDRMEEGEKYAGNYRHDSLDRN